MTFYLGRVGIKLHFLFFIVLAYMLSFEIGKYYITSLFYACIHEFAHIAVLSKLYDGDFTVTFGAFGMRLQYDDCVRFSLKNEAATEFSGPAVNAVMGTAFFILYKIQPDSEFFCISFIINASLGLFNLLPVIPLDGGRFLYNIISMKFTADKADSVLNVCGVVTLILFALFTVFVRFTPGVTAVFLYVSVSFILWLLKK